MFILILSLSMYYYYYLTISHFEKCSVLMIKIIWGHYVSQTVAVFECIMTQTAPSKYANGHENILFWLAISSILNTYIAIMKVKVKLILSLDSICSFSHDHLIISNYYQNMSKANVKPLRGKLKKLPFNSFFSQAKLNGVKV